MATIKQRRITKIVREFVKAQNSYDITGVDLALSKFFYRASQELFQDLSTGDYRVDTSAGKQTLVITNQEILSAAEAFQVGYVLDFTATKYETQWNVDINTLKDRYNQLVDNTQELWEYIRKTGFISDDTTIDLILPQLDINEVWVRGENGYVGMPINDIQVSIKDAIQKYLLEVVYPTIDGYVDATSKPALDEYVETTIKPEIDDFTDAKEVELQDLKDILANQLQELVDNALADRGVIPNGTDWNTLSYGTWYVSDLNGSNYTNHPNLEDTEGVGVVLVTDSQGGSAKVIRYYSMQKKMHFKIKNATGFWSEWSALSSGGGVRYEYTQANHGFLFTPVMLDGISGEWVRATTNGADGIAVYISRDRFELIMNGSVQIPNSAKDVNGDVFVNDEYYFLSNNVAGGLDREKPTGIFQPMIRTYLDEQGRMWAEVEVDTPVDLVPRVLNEEAEALGIQMQVDNRLQTESKVVVEAINELNDRVGIENTIADLVASNRYALGDVVEVLGFHAKGDGSHHKRIAKDENDGSGEQGQNGIWWCVVHSGEVNVSWFGAKGDGVTDDTDAIQKAFEYQYFSSRCKVKFGEGTFITSKPLNVYGAQSGYLDFDTFIEGSGRETTFIKKTGSTTSDNSNYTDINAVFIIMNEYQKNNTIDTPYSNQSITRRVHIDTLTLETDSRAIGIHSKGFFYCYFTKIGLKKTSIGMETNLYNCYNRFDSIEVDASNVAAFRFLSPIGGNTTAEFRNIHLNGCNGIGYDIKGGLANFFMCTCDGGNLINYQITGSANLENCHYESPSAKSFVKTLSSGRGINISHVISVNNCTIEMPVPDDTICFDLSDTVPTTFIVGNGTRIHRANRSTSPEILKGKIFSLGEKTVLSVGDVKITGITNEGQNIYRNVDFIEIKDIKDFTDTHTYNRYTSSAVSDFSFSQMDISSTDEGYIKLTSKGKANNCNIGQAIFKPIDLTKYNRINVSFKIENESGSGTGTIRLFNEQPCYQGRGVTQTSVKSYVFNYVDKFTEAWLDVSDLVGEHYISIDPSSNTNIIIEKICIY